MDLRRISATSPSSRNMNRRVTGQQRRHVGSDEILVDAEPDDHRAALARQHDALRDRLGHDRERVGALELGDGAAHRLEQLAGAPR